MSRGLSTATKNAAAADITTPCYLVELRLAATYRFSSRGDVPWNGFTFASSALRVSDVSDAPDGSSQVRVEVGNTDLAFGAAVLLDAALQGRGVSVWFHYGAAPAAADPVKLFEGVVDSAGIDQAAVRFMLTNAIASATYLPRRRITRAAGFTRLLPAGRVIQIGTQMIRLERR